MVPLISVLAPILGDLVKRIIPDSDKGVEIEREIKLSLLEHADSIEALRGKIVLSEAQSSSWLTSTWRPLLMMVMVAIIAINYLLFPLANLFLVEPIVGLDLPSELWNLLQIGVGGYIVGRSGEKMVTSWRDKDGD